MPARRVPLPIRRDRSFFSFERLSLQIVALFARSFRKAHDLPHRFLRLLHLRPRDERRLSEAVDDDSQGKKELHHQMATDPDRLREPRLARWDRLKFAMDVKRFFEDFQDHLAPKLDTYEQAIYLYVVRQSRLKDCDEVVIGFKSARHRLATGIGEAGKAMAEPTAYAKLKSLETKGAVTILAIETKGTRMRANLPWEIPDVVPPVAEPREPCRLEDLDFFDEPALRQAIFAREQGLCFFCRRKLTPKGWVIEHVRSRPEGTNGFLNVVAACISCNNSKKAMDARDYVRVLHRNERLSDSEWQERMNALKKLEAGELRPEVPPEYLR